MVCINGIWWNIVEVNYNSPFLKRTNGTYTIGCTNWNTKTIYIAPIRNEYLRENVICHELTHAFCFSNNIHMDIEEEERLCCFMAMYGRDIIYLLDEVIDMRFLRVA